MDNTTESEATTAAEVAEKMYGGATKGVEQLLRRGRITKPTAEFIKTNVDFLYNTIKGHECNTAVYTLSEGIKAILNIGSLVTAFEDHVEEGHDGEETGAVAPDKGPDMVTERKDNVIHVDLSKGKAN